MNLCRSRRHRKFGDTDCLVLSEEFQLPDASQVVLRIPRKHDLYTFHISDLQPEQKVTCFVAKASLDESTRWHRRMAHVNFKTINKLAKEGLVDGDTLEDYRSFIQQRSPYLWNAVQIKQKIYAKLQRQEHELRTQLHIGVSAVKDPAGVDSAVKDPAGVDSAVKDPAGVDSAVKDSAGVDSADGVSTGSPSADSDPAVGNPADSFPPAGRVEPTDESNPAVSSSISADVHPVYADESTLPPGHQLGSKEVYVTQPKGFEDPYFPKHVYRVVKALYGLHQAPRAWYARLSTFLLQHNYRRGTIDKTLFIKKDSRDIILVQVKQLPDGLFISQDKYVKDMLTKFDMESVLWIQNQLLDYGFNFMNTKIFIDNQSTICIVKNPVFHQRTKHIEIRHHFIRDANEKNLIQVLKIHTDDNVADLLTKAFDGPRFALVSAGCTMVLLVVVLPAGRMVSAGWSMVLLVVIFPAARLVSAGRTMILLVVILSAGCFVSADSYGLCC
ncbi:putative ribonuclease H-like domain-containing protein [Tanacetum coccineum]